MPSGLVSAGSCGVEHVQRRRVGADDHPPVLVVEVQQTQVAEPTLLQTLIVEQHRVDRAVGLAVAVVVDRVGARVRVVVVAGADREDVRVGLDDLVEDALRDRPQTTGGEHVFVQVDPHLALGRWMTAFIHAMSSSLDAALLTAGQPMYSIRKSTPPTVMRS
jgi:hypothetical protein